MYNPAERPRGTKITSTVGISLSERRVVLRRWIDVIVSSRGGPRGGVTEAGLSVGRRRLSRMSEAVWTNSKIRGGSRGPTSDDFRGQELEPHALSSSEDGVPQRFGMSGG